MIALITHPITSKILTRFVIGAVALFVLVIQVIIPDSSAWADTYPPDWDSGTGTAVHFQPVAWPTEPADPADCGQACGEWLPYTRFNNATADPRVQDPSNGGTTPQNYVNIASSCIDKALPSIYYKLDKHATDPSLDVIMFRWRVEQVANTYATGPNAGSYSSTDPWNSALWTVLFDVDGDGFRDLAAHLDGSSGSPSTKIDRIVGIWGDIPTQSVDYTSNPDIHEIAHNPTAFTSGSTILNFADSLTPTTSWPNGSAETSWDYGTTRSKRVSTSSCTEYFIDYQIPVAMLDASGFGGPTLERSTPLAMLFCTANSLNNPFQKDCVLNNEWLADPLKPGAFGDFISFDKDDPYQQPIVDDIQALGCGNYTLTATVKDVLAVINGEIVASVQSVDFYYYYDTDADGVANDGNTWTLAANGALANLNKWTASWDATSLLQGQYLIGVQALDDPSKVDDDMPTDGNANRMFSYLTQAEVDLLTPPAGETWWANPAITGTKSVELALNACGSPTPFLSKSVNLATVSVGDPVVFTITVNNTLSSPITVTSVSDMLPIGFTFVSTDGGTLGAPSTSPTGSDTGTINWTFPTVSVAGGGTGTLIFTANASNVVGNYSNTATAETSYTSMSADPVQIAVGAPRLTIAKSASSLSVSPGDPVTYTITYSNDSSIDADNVVITDVLPTGMTYVAASASNSGVYVDGTRTITWSLGTLTAGTGPFTVTFQVTIVDPYPSGATVPLVNTGTIDSDQTSPASAKSSIYVDTPLPSLSITKSPNKPLLDPAGTDPDDRVVYTIDYANDGTGGATGVVVSDATPTGFTYVSSSPTADSAPTAGMSGTITWNIGALAAGASGSVMVTMEASDPYTGDYPSINTANALSDQNSTIMTTAQVGVKQGAEVCNAYYYRGTTGDVGTDGTKNIATISPVPVAGDTGASTTVVAPASGSSFLEVVRFYQDPATSGDINFNGNITTIIYIDRTNGAGITIRAQVLDYNSTDGTTTQLGTQDTDFGGNTKGSLTNTVATTGTLSKDHRLLFVYSILSKTSGTPTIQFQYDGTVTNTQSSGTTIADSNANFCVTSPAELVVDKSVDKASASAGDTLTYTINYSNAGQTGATGAVLTDTLPSGMGFVSGSPAPASAPSVGSSGVVTWNIGAIGAASSGSVTLTATIDDPLSASITSLLNPAALVSDQTSEVTDSATTTILGTGSSGPPVLVISKSVDKTTALPGDTVTYSITVLNSGGSDASTISVTDVIPANSWYTYVASSISGGDSRDASGSLALSWTINSLVPGASVTLSFQMVVAASGVPSGITVLDNSASATETTAGTENSNTVSVAVNTNPNLNVSKTVSPTGTRAPGDTLTYTVVVTNNGSADATDVEVRDPIPTNVSFVPGSITATPTGTGSLDAVNNRIVYDVGTLAASGGSTTLTFKGLVAASLPNGTTNVTNTATASASNAASVNDNVVSAVDAAPVLAITKFGPSSVPFPAATLTADVSVSATLNLDNTTLLTVGQIVMLGGTSYEIKAINGQQVTLDTTVTASSGAELIPTIPYSILYQNTGNADATSTSITDTIPPGLGFLSGSPVPGTKPAVGSSGSVVWTIGTIAAGDSGTVTLLVYPTSSGDYTNNVTLASAELSDKTDSVVTNVGGLIVRKSTSTPVRSPGDVATYTITVENTLTTTVGSVNVTDTLSSGFTYKSTTSISGAASGPSNPNPISGDTELVWGVFSIAAGATLTIVFDADIASNVGPADYQNPVTATAATGVAISPFDPLLTTDEDVTVLAAGTGLVEGVVYKDNDSSGSLTGGDARFAGIQVSVTDSDSTLFTPSTDSSGYFSQVVAPGSTTVDVLDSALPSGLSLTTGSTNSTIVTVPANGVATDNTGYVETVPATISGIVWHDLNGNGVKDGGETGISGVTVTLSGTNSAATTTDSNGAYSFTGLDPGSYTVVETNPGTHPNNSTSNSVAVTLTSGASQTVDFGDFKPPSDSISGTVWDDLNNNGVLDPGEPGIAGVSVTLTGPGGPFNTTTNSIGAYSFTALSLGDYTVVETNPGIHPNNSTSNSVAVTLTSGVSQTVNFGDYSSTASPPENIPSLNSYNLLLLSLMILLLAMIEVRNRRKYRRGWVRAAFMRQDEKIL